MKLCYRGVSYEHHERCLFQPKAVSQSVRVLCYRGVFYIQEGRSTHPERTSPEAMRSLNSTQSDFSHRRCVRHPQRMGFFYKLYCVGWRNGSLQLLSPFQHWLLSHTSYYYRGYTEGSEWRQYLDSQRSRE